VSYYQYSIELQDKLASKRNSRDTTGLSRWRHVIKAGASSKSGSGFWVIKKVMEGRIKITESVTDPGKPITKKQWIPKNGEMYKQISGNLDTEKIVHLQYLSCLDDSAANLYWGKDPVFSLDTESIVNNVIAPASSLVRLDRWSYDQKDNSRKKIDKANPYFSGIKVIK
jgi:hypothetical protein